MFIFVIGFVIFVFKSILFYCFVSSVISVFSRLLVRMGPEWSLIRRGWSQTPPRHFWGTFGTKLIFHLKKNVQQSWNVHMYENRFVMFCFVLCCYRGVRDYHFLSVWNICGLCFEKMAIFCPNQKDAYRNSASFDVPDSSPSFSLTPFMTKT